ncbi:unnamed protein product [Hymenolepis diminuta]|uniref:DUF5727 domain-containing protein n=1 Tax=Hymenolepis diminuta TaxID=6216 RepID=A0A564Z9N3_HYMDI|nr:unnamed protein product [Hymenolepis diminuta]
MYFNLTNVPEILVYKKDSYLFYLTIENGSCIVYGKIVGSPCAVQADQTVITLDEVPDYDVLVVQNLSLIYTVYFAKDCKFPPPKDGKKRAFKFTLCLNPNS